MSESEALWKILTCPECGGLMKVSRQQAPEQLACPGCGATLGDGGQEDPRDQADQSEPVEVIRAGMQEPQEQEELDLEDELEDELGELDPLPPELGPASSSHSPVPETSIPAPRREEYKMPELISNVGERGWSPGASGEKQAPKFDKAKLGSTSDERLAAEPEDEEGAVIVHVARKIAGWDLDEEDQDPKNLPGEKAGEGASLKGQLAMFGIAVVIALFVGLIVYGLIQSLREKEVVVREEEKPIEEVAREAMSTVERDALDNSEETFAAAGEVIEKFLNAADYRERLEFVRDAARVEPLMEAYYQTNPDGPIPFRAPEDGWRMEPFNSFLLTVVVLRDYSESPIATERQDDGRFLIDWESYVGYSEIPLDELAERKPLEPVLLRARASRGDYYNYGFSNSGEWACVQLQDQTRRNTIYGYVRLEDPLLQALGKIVPSGGAAALVTLKVAYPPDGEADNQFLITELVTKGWVFSDSDDEPDADRGDVDSDARED